MKVTNLGALLNASELCLYVLLRESRAALENAWRLANAPRSSVGIAYAARVAVNKHSNQTDFLRMAEELRGLTGAAAQAQVLELIETAHSIGVPTAERRDDAPVFLAGTEPIETATWTQCGGILFALKHHEALDAVAVAAQVAARVAVLAPTHVPQLARELD